MKGGAPSAVKASVSSRAHSHCHRKSASAAFALKPGFRVTHNGCAAGAKRSQNLHATSRGLYSAAKPKTRFEVLALVWRVRPAASARPYRRCPFTF